MNRFVLNLLAGATALERRPSPRVAGQARQACGSVARCLELP